MLTYHVISLLSCRFVQWELGRSSAFRASSRKGSDQDHLISQILTQMKAKPDETQASRRNTPKRTICWFNLMDEVGIAPTTIHNHSIMQCETKIIP